MKTSNEIKKEVLEAANGIISAALQEIWRIAYLPDAKYTDKEKAEIIKAGDELWQDYQKLEWLECESCGKILLVPQDKARTKLGRVVCDYLCMEFLYEDIAPNFLVPDGEDFI